jgi:hypothetical protein
MRAVCTFVRIADESAGAVSPSGCASSTARASCSGLAFAGRRRLDEGGPSGVLVEGGGPSGRRDDGGVCS